MNFAPGILAHTNLASFHYHFPVQILLSLKNMMVVKKSLQMFLNQSVQSSCVNDCNHIDMLHRYHPVHHIHQLLLQNYLCQAVL